MSLEGPIVFASLKSRNSSESRPFDKPPDPGCVPEPTARWADSTEKGPRWSMYNPRCSMGLYSSSGIPGGRKVLHDSRAISMGHWRVGQAGGSRTSVRGPLVVLECSLGGNGLFSACVANGPGIGLVRKSCAPVMSGPPAPCE